MKQRNTLCTITLDPTCIALSLFSYQNNNLSIHAHESHSIDNLALADGLIYNPTYIDTITNQFIQKYKFAHKGACIAIDGPAIKEMQTVSPHAQAQKLQLPRTKNSQWQTTFLHPTQDNQFAFYACSIDQPTLFQYTLFALRNKLSLKTLTTFNSARLCAYKYMNKDTFRHSQLGMHLDAEGGAIEKIINKEMVFRMMQAAPDAQLPDTLDPALVLVHVGLAVGSLI